MAPGLYSFAPPAADRVRFREQGVYLITGGLGKIGLEIAAEIAGQVPAKLILLSRSGVPDRAHWSDILESDDARTIRRIEGPQRIEAAGGQVIAGTFDIAPLVIEIIGHGAAETRVRNPVR